ncbi:MAG TPA: glycosyltransferase family 1 protein [Verrucomicrobiae bacterium]|nr:glycosyltransferase family 1 protein [Verrucomicrobiae bacterium]
MRRILLVPDLPAERWPSMDRYAARVAQHLPREAADLQIDLSSKVPGFTPGTDTPVSDASGEARLPLPGFGPLGRYGSRYLTYPRRVGAARVDLVHVLDHSYAHVVHSVTRAIRVVTVHDLFPVMTVARRDTGLRARVRDRLLGWVLSGLRRADAWVVGTEWLRGGLAEWLGHEKGIHVIPFGVDDHFFTPTPEPREAVRRRLGIPSSAFVVLHVGNVAPRKNLPGVIAAVHGLRVAGTDAWLVRVGDALTREQQDDVEGRGMADRVKALGATSEPELRAVYRTADVLLFPSHYEGFGFPVLEAMASGLPVVTSGLGGLVEAAGRAAVVVGDQDVDRYVAELRRLAAEPGWREQVIARGTEHARRFRWADTARRMAELYRSLV